LRFIKVLTTKPATMTKVLDAGRTNPHTRCVSGGSSVQRQVAGTNGEALTSVGVSFCLAPPPSHYRVARPIHPAPRADAASQYPRAS